MQERRQSVSQSEPLNWAALCLAGYLACMGTPTIKIRQKVLEQHDAFCSIDEIKALVADFNARYPPPVRGLLCRYALTLSQKFHHAADQLMTRNPTTAADGMSKHFRTYLTYLRSLYSDMGGVLYGEVLSSQSLFGTSTASPKTAEATIARWYQQHRDADRPSSLSAAFAKQHGNDLRLRQYSAMLYNRSVEQTGTLALRETALFNDVCQFLRYLTSHNPVDVIG